MNREDYEQYAAQIAGQKEVISAQGEESLKSFLPTLHQQMQEHQAVVIEQINPRKVVNEVILELDGKEVDLKGDIIQVSKPYVNGVGLRNIKLIMRSVINQNIVLSSLVEKDVERLMIRLADDLAFDLALNWREYGIKNRNICNTVMNIVLFNSYSALKRSQDRNEKRFLQGISFESINGASQAAKKGKSSGGTWESFASRLRL